MSKYLLQRRGYLKTADFTVGQDIKDANGNNKVHLLQIKPAAGDVGTITVMYPSGQTEAIDLAVEGMDAINSNPIQVMQIVATTLTINQDFYLYE